MTAESIALMLAKRKVTNLRKVTCTHKWVRNLNETGYECSVCGYGKDNEDK